MIRSINSIFNAEMAEIAERIFLLSAISAISAFKSGYGYLGTSTVLRMSEITASVVAPSSSASARSASR